MDTTRFASFARSAATAAVSTAIAATVLAGCGTAAPAPPAQALAVQSLAAGEYVGEVPELNAFVAVVAEAPSPGGADRALRAYLCDGQGMGAWFPGRAGTTAQLSATAGEGTIDVAIAPDAATGTIVLADGRTAPFRAHPAQGPAGLFDVDVLADGELRGSSTDGDRLQGRIEQAQADGGFDGAGTITTPDGTSPFSIWLSSTDAFTGRAVFLEDGRSRGRSTSADARGFKIWA